MARETWAQDAAQDKAEGDAGSHPLNRSGRNSRGGGRRRRLGRGGFLRNGLGRGHHGLLGGGLLQHLSTLLTIIGLLKGIFGKKKTVGRGGAGGGAGRHRKPRKGKILRARAVKGMRRPPAVRQPRSPGGGGSTRRPNLTYVTGVFDVATGKIKRRRLLG